MFIALALACFIGAWVWPVWQVHRALRRYADAQGVDIDGLEPFSGPADARKKMRLYLGLPGRLTPNRRYVPDLLYLCVGEGEEPASVAPHLIRLLGDPDPEVRSSTAFILGKIRPPGALDLLSRACRDPAPFVRGAALQGLSDLGHPEAVDLVIKALRDDDPRIRWAAAESLRVLRVPRAVEPLKEALKDSDSKVRQAAASALEKIKAAQEKK
jgi:HEAT repeat protein